MTAIAIEGGRALRGRVKVPGDKSISHRALLLAARAVGTSILRGLSDGDDVLRTRAALEDLGTVLEQSSRPAEVRVTGGHLHEAGAVLYIGNSGTSIRLLAGLVAAYPWLTIIQGDESIARRPIDRVVAPLRLMGAAVDGRAGAKYPPLVIRGGGIHGIDYTPPVASAQVKTAILLAGLGAEGETVVREPVTTRRHTEELLELCGAALEVAETDGGQVVALRASELQPFELDVPSDPSQAAFWVVAACVIPGSEVVVEGVYVGPGRASFIDVLLRMGADINIEMRDRTTADVTARFAPLAATEISGAEIPSVVDEIPVLAVAAAMAEGATRITDAAELAVKESDRISTTAGGLSALGIRVEAREDGLVVFGGSRPAGGCVDTHGDHRIAMAMAVAALAGTGRTEIRGWEATSTSYPGFEADLRGLLEQG